MTTIVINDELIDRFAILIASHQQDTDDYNDGNIEAYQLADRIEGYEDSMRELAAMCGIPTAAMEVKIEAYMVDHRECLGLDEEGNDAGTEG